MLELHRVLQGYKWCPEPESNQRHADFQSKKTSFCNNTIGSKEYHDKPGTTGERETPIRKLGGLLTKCMRPEHKRMSRMLGYTLHIGEPDAWGGFSIVARIRLSLRERAGLAIAALGSLPSVEAREAAAAALGAAGDPLPAFLGGMDDARFWASIASENELKAYALACFEAMPPKDQAAFFRHISAIEVAA